MRFCGRNVLDLKKEYFEKEFIKRLRAFIDKNTPQILLYVLIIAAYI